MPPIAIHMLEMSALTGTPANTAYIVGTAPIAAVPLCSTNYQKTPNSAASR